MFGTEYCEISVYVNAINVLTKLSVNSLSEDKYGHVQRDVATIIRTFTTVIKTVEKFKAEFPSHWLDGKTDKKCKEVDDLVAALRAGLEELLGAFGEYADDLRLSRADVRQAREAVRLDKEMTEVR